jgi:hypothetical protein
MRWFAHIAVGLDDAVLHYASGPCARWDGTPSSGARGDRQGCCVHNRPVTERLVRPATRPRSRRVDPRPVCTVEGLDPCETRDFHRSPHGPPGPVLLGGARARGDPLQSAGEDGTGTAGWSRRGRQSPGAPPLKVAREQSGCSHRKRRLRQIRYVVDRSSRGGGLKANGTRRERKVARRLSAPYVVR